MHGSATVGWLLSALCAFVAAVCLLRARGAGGMRRRAATSEALMGLGMAAMALPGSVSAALSPLVFLMLFGAVSVRELALLLEARRTGGQLPGPAGPEQPRRPRHFHHLHHLVGALAMIYMALAMQASHGAPAGAGGHAAASAAASGLPLVTGALLVYYAAYVLRTGLLLLPAAPSGGSGAAGTAGGGCAAHDVPGLAAACRVAMGTGMLAMLLML
ncbi:hypothetical protein DB35_06055 [Streptomyces abyssalis]|uniref:DUF5134 domain-containing protein n=2 Tax=Streptomyces abyssalis TaxID=933944 RepID=A0A1E7JT83_9ACTN|nr:DUF5134 domain-containing protein [Streptomyces abyssalis]OEU92104.1 hypothetical protein AN215_06690 [Streptomyces abyssalis]OEU94616.1 hypothetical protein DB35_06055 [Streptomyces abyssalis]